MTDYPRKWEDLTPEQQEAVREFWQQLAENMRQMSHAFLAIASACVEAVRNIEAVDWKPGDWAVSDDPIMTGKPYHDHGDDSPCGPDCAPSTPGDPQ